MEWIGPATSSGAPPCGSITTTGTVLSPTSLRARDWMLKCTAWRGRRRLRQDGFPDILVTCVGQNRLFHNTGKGTFLDVTNASGLGKRSAFSTSALWFDYDRDGLLDLFVCNYVKWSPEHDVFCQPRWQAQILLHARGLSRRDLLAVS